MEGILKAIGFGCDGTLWYGDPPGPIEKWHLEKAKAKGYIIGGSSGQSVEEQRRQWGQNGLEPGFVVTKSELSQLPGRFDELIYVGDAQDDAEWAQRARARHMTPDQFIKWLDKVFDRYGEYYDLIYHDKDYEKECDFLESVFKKYSSIPVKSIFDGGCGTGGHAIPLARRGYKVVGLDASEVMIGKALEKGEKAGLEMDFRVADLCSLDLDRKFDAAVSMFSVMSYITTNHDFAKVVGNMRRILKEGGLFIFDVWNGFAVVRSFSEDRVKSIEDGSTRVVRWIHAELDLFNHVCNRHHLLLVTEGDRVVDDVLETHILRYFFPQEITHYLEENGFQVLEICPFLNLGGRVDENAWDITCIARTRRT